MIDLHLHSACSDGSLTPANLAARVAEAGLYAAALTDHDTVSGVAEFAAAAAGGFAAVGGVEISVAHAPGTLHLLGYFVDPADPPLTAALGDLRAGRDDRNRRILERLSALGISLDERAVRAYAGDEVVGRPHIAMAMAAAGYVRDTREAFDRYLGKGAPAYCDRFRLSVTDAIALIHGAGGLAVLAHPFTLAMTAASLDDFVAGLARSGLQGIEAYYPEHDASQTACCLELTRRYRLAATGGTDFHGELNPKLRIGVGFGGLSVPDSLYDGLRRRRDRMAAAVAD